MIKIELVLSLKAMDENQEESKWGMMNNRKWLSTDLLSHPDLLKERVPLPQNILLIAGTKKQVNASENNIILANNWQEKLLHLEICNKTFNVLQQDYVLNMIFSF